MKRISSTNRRSRPKKRVEETAPEPAEVMSADVNAKAGAEGGKSVAGRVVLPASCTIKEARALQTHLLEQLELPGPCEIDGGGVQLVLAFALDCLERNLPYVWKRRSAPLEEAIRVLGVGALLEYPA